MAQVVGYNGTALETKPEVAYWMCELLYDYLMRTEGKPFIVTQNDGGVRSGGIPLPEGDITMNYMYGLMPFDNAIVVMEMSGTDLIALLERPESELVSKLDFYGAQKFDDEWLLLADNEPITADGVYNVMCNDFMHTGGDNFDFSKGTNVRYLGTPLRDAMVEETEFRIGGATTSFNSARTPRRVLLAALIGG
jgi:2',3'-cyclic-nucleotide 2'-phosphodiesterase (5'-nucleotidase family)